MSRGKAPDPGDGVISLLAAILQGTPKLPDARCVRRSELFLSSDPECVEAAVSA